MIKYKKIKEKVNDKMKKITDGTIFQTELGLYLNRIFQEGAVRGDGQLRITDAL